MLAQTPEPRPALSYRSQQRLLALGTGPGLSDRCSLRAGAVILGATRMVALAAAAAVIAALASPSAFASVRDASGAIDRSLVS
jgi:hypothetical protein